MGGITMKRRGRMGAIGCLLASMLIAGAIVPASAAADSTVAVISDQETEDVIAADQEAEGVVAPSEEDLLSAQAIEGDLSFIDQDGTTQTLSGSDFKADLAQVSGDSVTLKDGWYYVSANKTFNNRVEVSGEVQLILGDEVQLDCKREYTSRILGAWRSLVSWEARASSLPTPPTSKAARASAATWARVARTL